MRARRSRWSRRVAFAMLAALTPGCGAGADADGRVSSDAAVEEGARADAATDSPTSDVALDASTSEAGDGAIEAALDGGLDAGDDVADDDSAAMTDAPDDVLPDATSDAAPDADGAADAVEPPDAGVDAGVDAGIDATVDAGGAGDAAEEPAPDAASDAGSPGADASDAADGDACEWLAACVPANPCDIGQVHCDTQPASCVDTTFAAADGTSCGAGGVCLGGACTACGASCTPSWSCHVWTVDCSGAAPVCTDTGGPRAEHASCGQDLFCLSGNCTSCTSGSACVPADPCHLGTWTCGTSPACVDGGASAADGTSCAGGALCRAGACAPGPYTLVVVAGGTQTPWVDQRMASPLVLELRDANGVPVPAAALSASAPPGAVAAFVGGDATTDASGRASISLRANRLPSAGLRFRFAGPAGAKLAFDLPVLAPPDGTIFTLLNVDRAPTTGLAGVATVTGETSVDGLAVGADGTVYYSDASQCVVRAITPEGEIVDLAGDPSFPFCQHAGDGVPGAAAHLASPTALALDEAARVLYIAETGADLVRRVHLDTGTIDTYAGGGSDGAEPYGDEGPALGATLSHPSTLTLGPAPPGRSGRGLWVTDGFHRRLRFIDSGAKIHAFTGLPTTSDCSQETLALANCGGNCGVAWDASGTLFVSGNLCGSALGSGYASAWGGAIARVDAAGATLVAGTVQTGASSAAPDGAPASSAYFATPPTFTFEPSDDLLAIDGADARVRRIGGSSTLLATAAGTGTAGALGDYGPATQATIGASLAMTVDASRHVYLADPAGHGIRQVWHGARSSTAGASLTDASDAPARSPWVDAPTSGLRAKLSVGGAPVAGVPVAFTSLDPGGAIHTPTLLTRADGTVEPDARVGLAPGTPYRFRARYVDLHGRDVAGSPLTLAQTPSAPAKGTIFSATNVYHLYSTSMTGTPGPGTLAYGHSRAGLAPTSDGGLYFTSACGIHHLLPSGHVDGVLGGPSPNGVGCPASSGDGGPANAATATIAGLALDEAAKRLYFSDSGSRTLRWIDLATGVVHGLATSGATIAEPTALALGAGGLFVVDGSFATPALRFVDSAGVATTTPVPVSDQGGSLCGLDVAFLVGISYLAWDPVHARVYLSGTICGAGIGGNAGVVSYDPATRAVKWVAGQNLGVGGVQTEGVAATSAYFGSAPTMDVDASGALFLAIGGGGEARFRTIAADGTIHTVAGAAPGDITPSGEYVPWTTATYQAPSPFRFTSTGGLWIVDWSWAVRRVW